MKPTKDLDSLQLQQAILKLDLEQQRSLSQWLTTTIQEQEQSLAKLEALPPKPGREVVDKQLVGTVIYQLEAVRCGKPTCKCAKGELHGPYWYAYQRQEGKLKSWYVGKQSPPNNGNDSQRT